MVNTLNTWYITGVALYPVKKNAVFFENPERYQEQNYVTNV